MYTQEQIDTFIEYLSAGMRSGDAEYWAKWMRPDLGHKDSETIAPILEGFYRKLIEDHAIEVDDIIARTRLTPPTPVEDGDDWTPDGYNNAYQHLDLD